MTSSEAVAALDPLHPILNIVATALREAFDPDSEYPPLGGGGTEVRFFAGEYPAAVAWQAHQDGPGCDAPFLWVRLMRRYKSRVFPTPDVHTGPCASTNVAAIEIGVARCAITDLEPTWQQWAVEAEVSRDDSWRMALALCRAASRLAEIDPGTQTGTDIIEPQGPDGGVIAWTGIIYVSH